MPHRCHNRHATAYHSHHKQIVSHSSHNAFVQAFQASHRLHRYEQEYCFLCFPEFSRKVHRKFPNQLKHNRLIHTSEPDNTPTIFS